MKGKFPNDPRIIFCALATTASCENKPRDKCRCANAIEPVNNSPNITNKYQSIDELIP